MATAEEQLNLVTQAFGGFEGNAHSSFRVVTRLSLRSRAYDALNLTRQTLNALLKIRGYATLSTQTARRNGARTTLTAPSSNESAMRGQNDFPRSLEAEIMDGPTT